MCLSSLLYCAAFAARAQGSPLFFQRPLHNHEQVCLCGRADPVFQRGKGLLFVLFFPLSPSCSSVTVSLSLTRLRSSFVNAVKREKMKKVQIPGQENEMTYASFNQDCT
jgi:hypothetical protein